MSAGNFYHDLFAAAPPGDPALRPVGGGPVTYGELGARAGAMARAFRESGARPGDRVLAQIEKSVDAVAAYLGAMRAGLVWVPLNTAYTDEEVAYFADDAAPTLAIFAPGRAAALALVTAKTGLKASFVLGADGATERASDLARAAGQSPADERAAESAAMDAAPCSAGDLAVILYTSGTTGRPKGAMLAHANLRANAAALRDVWRITAQDRLIHALPIFHIHGLFVALHAPMLAGAEIVFLPRFDLDLVFDATAGATLMMGVPTFYTRMMADERFSRESVTRMRLFISGSAPFSEADFARFEARSGHRILERYGMSEAGIITSNRIDADRRPGSVGAPLPHTRIRIVGEDGAALPDGEAGEVEVDGPGVFSGYWRRGDQTAESLRDGWLRTGDVGLIDARGELRLVGRAKDLIIVGGYNVYPKEVEAVIERVAGVEECAVFGAPHADMGEGVVAAIVGDGAREEDLRDALDALAKFKRPRRFVRLDALPRNAMGKVQKQRLRDAHKDVFRSS